MKRLKLSNGMDIGLVLSFGYDILFEKFEKSFSFNVYAFYNNIGTCGICGSWDEISSTE